MARPVRRTGRDTLSVLRSSRRWIVGIDSRDGILIAALLPRLSRAARGRTRVT